jgi:hypothetical protein
MVKGVRGTNVKVLIQGLHMTSVVFVLVYNFIICILGTPFNIAFYIKYILIKNLILYHVYYNSCP